MITENHALILATTQDFFGKFEQRNAALLREMGFCVHYAANMKEPSYLSVRDAIDAAGVQTHHIDIARSPFLLKENQRAFRQLLQLIRRYRIRLLHCHTPVGGLLGRLAGACSCEQPVVIYTAHGFHFYKGAPAVNRTVYYEAEQVLARKTDILIVINQEDYLAAEHFALKKGGLLFKIPGAGLDTVRFSPLSPAEKRLIRSQIGVGEDDFFLVSAGELNQNKNHGIVLEALCRIRRETGALSGLRYAICGDGFLRGELEESIRRNGLEDTVMLLGYRNDAGRIMGSADAAVFPSRREGLGMAGLEALSMGVPVIASDNRGTREYMEHGKNGFVCRYDDVAGFAEGIRKMMSLQPQSRSRMKRYCRASVRPFAQEYTDAVMRRIYVAAQEKILQKEEAGRFERHKSQGQCDHGEL